MMQQVVPMIYKIYGDYWYKAEDLAKYNSDKYGESYAFPQHIITLTRKSYVYDLNDAFDNTIRELVNRYNISGNDYLYAYNINGQGWLSQAEKILRMLVVDEPVQLFISKQWVDQNIPIPKASQCGFILEVRLLRNEVEELKQKINELLSYTKV